MTVREALNRAREILSAASIADPSLESEVLLRHVLKKDRAGLFLDYGCELHREDESTFWALVKRRLSHEPTAYITGHREFYGRDFYVDRNVLVPRPETELLVEKALEATRTCPSAVIAEIGTGSGAIAITLALELPSILVYAADVSSAALEVARRNCREHGVTERVHLLHGDMLAPLPSPVSLVIANLPYVPTAELKASIELAFEPSLALDGGLDGLDKIRMLAAQLEGRILPGGCLLLEVGRGQGQQVAGILQVAKHNVFPEGRTDIFPDLAGIERVVRLLLPARV